MLRHLPKISFPKESLIKKALKNSERKLDKAEQPRRQRLTRQLQLGKDVDKDIPKDKPFNPSITLNECVTPVVANIVNNIANGDNKKN